MHGFWLCFWQMTLMTFSNKSSHQPQHIACGQAKG